MKALIIACDVLYREVSLALANSKHVVDVRFLNSELHNTPSELRKTLQEEIYAADGKGYEYVILGYGLCSRGTAELTAGSVPLVIPRAHDCITFFLGSRAKYDKEFLNHPGTYYYSSGWIERKNGEVQQGYIEESSALNEKARFEEYVEKYGEDNAKFLIEQESLWLANYTRTAYIHMGLGAIDQYRQFVQDVADKHGWSVEEIEGDISLFQRLAAGNWNEDFLIVPPGAKTRESFDTDIICACCKTDVT